MSITLIRDVFHNLNTYDSWYLQLLQIKNSKRNGTTYFSREITLSPSDALTKFVREISESYCSNENGIDKNYLTIVVALLLSTPVYRIFCEKINNAMKNRQGLLISLSYTWTVVLLLFCYMAIFGATYNAFIYFRF